MLVGACIDLADGGAPYAAINEVLARLGRSVSSPGGAPSDELLDALRRLTAERPVVLVLEDVHWSDRSTQDLLVRLARGPAVPRLLVLATYRSDDDLPRGHPLRRTLAELDRSDRVERVRLDGLGPADLLAQLEGIFDGRPDEDTVRAVLERSDGSPLLAEELAAAASSGGQVSIGLHELLLSRFDRLSPPTQDVLRVAAVGGRRVGHRLLAAVAEAPEPDADRGPARGRLVPRPRRRWRPLPVPPRPAAQRHRRRRPPRRAGAPPRRLRRGDRAWTDTRRR